MELDLYRSKEADEQRTNMLKGKDSEKVQMEDKVGRLEEQLM